MKKIKKYVVFISLIVALLTVSCASTNKSSSKGADSEDGRQNTSEITLATGSSANTSSAQGGKAGTAVSKSGSTSKSTENDQKKTKEKKAKETAAEKRARLEAEKLAKKQRKDPYTGWVYIPEKNFSITNGDVKLTLKGDTGSFGIYVIPETGSPIPVISTYDSFCSSFFSLKIGRKEYRLNREKGVKSEARRTPYGGQMAYTIDGQAQIVVDFSFLPSIATSSKVDMLRVTIYTINISKNTQSFTVKSVFDTLLGENAYTHFSTAVHSRIDAERQYMDLTSEKWVRSYNQSAAVQFLLNGKGITNPYCITMANKDILSQANWIPAIQEERSFSSVLSYNNSALGINWNPVFLDPMKSDIITFYISLAADGNEPAGKEFLAALAEGKTALSATLPIGFETTNVAPAPQSVSEDQLTTVYYEGMPVIATESEGEESEDGSVTSYSQNAGNNPKFDSAYLQALLKRIDEIEADPSLAQPGEIERLNKELDEILELLRSLQ